jgi:hypothetical protein
MKCPSCGRPEVRPSKRKARFGLIYQLRGYERYRCRECRYAFWEKLPDNPDERLRMKRRRGWAPFFQSQGRRRAVEIGVFVLMLLIFIFAFRYFVGTP